MPNAHCLHPVRAGWSTRFGARAPLILHVQACTCMPSHPHPSTRSHPATPPLPQRQALTRRRRPLACTARTAAWPAPQSACPAARPPCARRRAAQFREPTARTLGGNMPPRRPCPAAAPPGPATPPAERTGEQRASARERHIGRAKGPLSQVEESLSAAALGAQPHLLYCSAHHRAHTAVGSSGLELGFTPVAQALAARDTLHAIALLVHGHAAAGHRAGASAQQAWWGAGWRQRRAAVGTVVRHSRPRTRSPCPRTAE